MTSDKVLAQSPAASPPVFQSLSLAVVVLAIVVFLWALIAIRRLNRSEASARQRLRDAEARLNEAEAVIKAEPGILLIWRGRQEQPEKIVGEIHSDVQLPTDHDDLLDFASWLAPESVDALSDGLGSLRNSGLSFNIGVQTKAGELLEADGRTAGGTATLRFRMLIGERRDNTDLAHEVRRLGKQVHRLSAILDKAPFPIWLNDRSDQLVWVNDAYLKAVEINKLERVLKEPVRLIDPSTLKPIDDEADHAKGHIGRTDVIFAGNRRTMDVFKISTDTEDASFAIDMTSLTNMKRELDLQEKAHASTLDNLATAIAIFGPDQNLRFYNSAYAKLWEFDTNWLDSHPKDGEILDKLRAERRLPEQANYRPWKAEILSAYRTLEPQESWWHLPDGQSLHVISEQHPFGGVTYLYENATEQIQLESRYNAVIDVHSETLNSLDEGVGLFGPDGKLRLFNSAFGRFWELPEEMLRRKPHIDNVIEKSQKLFDDQGIWDDIKYCVTSLNEARNPLQDRISRPDGKVFDFNVVPLPGGNTLVTYLDVTDSAGIERALRERNEALEAGDRLKTNFLSNVSYELRTPLTNILGFAEGLSMGIAGELKEKQQEYLGHIRGSSNDLLSIIDAILDLTTIDAGAMELKLASIDIASLLEKTAHKMSEKIRQHDVTLQIEIADNVSSFIGDENRLDQIFSNLLSNAIGFSPASGIVHFGAKQDGEEIVIWVADSGRGMDPEFQKRAFERFQSVPIAGGHRGPGLGLAIVKSFVDLHEGKVSLISKLDKGTTVICRFPLAGPAWAQDQSSPSDQVLAG